jgi:ribosome-associated heat shock protein Hsp15
MAPVATDAGFVETGQKVPISFARGGPAARTAAKAMLAWSLPIAPGARDPASVLDVRRILIDRSAIRPCAPNISKGGLTAAPGANRSRTPIRHLPSLRSSRSNWRRATRSRAERARLDRQRIDKWLWHARIVRTRSAAAALAASGHVRINGHRVDAPSRAVRPGDVVTVALDRAVHVLRVVGFSERRGSTNEARRLCEALDPRARRDDVQD